MDLIEAKVLPVDCQILGKVLDHTYVESNAGDCWRCNGRNSGGEVIASGYSDLTIARCIGKNEVGIIYGVTGVCHQMSNRILASAGTQLPTIGGYFLSSLLYGSHGIDEYEWQERKFICNLEPHGASRDNLTNVLINKYAEVLATKPQNMLMFTPYGNQLHKKIGRTRFDTVGTYTKNWKLHFLNDAIDYSNNSISSSEYVSRVNAGANIFVHKVAKITSYTKVSKLIQQSINKATKIVLLDDSELKS
ncbi:hypothetical protein [Photobacterium carnosum]|uniref:hypothetical protein n=1 Tax=Photobacterium carnosum TaxID=2023717 RepID=UPI001E4630BD|nr:hypothetical protein [Photobacterium carnosum]MCD9493341.1 hypothetical protein [Photobacterium carnosum]